MSSIIQGIIEGREREDELAVALKQAQQITRGVKYDDTVAGIIAEIQALAGKLGIDPKSVKWAIDDVLEAKNNLESAVYSLDDLFKDAWQDEKYKNDDEEEGLTEESKAEIRARLDQAIQDFLDKGGQIEKIKPNRVRAKPGMSMASRHIGTPGEFSRQKKSSGPGMGRQLGAGKPVVNVEEEEKKPRTAKALIYQTDMYGAKGYYGQCKEPGCNHKTKTYDRAVQAQNAIKKHHQEHFKDIEEGYRAGAVGGAGLGIEKSPMEKVLEKPLGEQGVAGAPRVAAHTSEILAATDDGKIITIKVRAPDGTVKSMSNSDPLILQRWLNLKFGLRLPHQIAKKFVFDEGFTVVPSFDKERYQERPGLEGPFHTKIGKVVYYDKQEGKYYDPDTDMYIDYDDWQEMNEEQAPMFTPEEKMVKAKESSIMRGLQYEGDTGRTEWSKDNPPPPELLLNTLIQILSNPMNNKSPDYLINLWNQKYGLKHTLNSLRQYAQNDYKKAELSKALTKAVSVHESSKG